MKEKQSSTQKKREPVKPKTMYVTNKVIRYENEVFNISSITRIGINEIEPEKKEKNLDLMTVPISLFLIALGLSFVPLSGTILSVLGTGMVALGIAGITLILTKKDAKKYLLFFELNSGKTANFIGDSKSVVENVFESITEAMKKDDFKPISYNFNSFDYKVDRSIRVGGSSFGNLISGDNAENTSNHIDVA